MATEFFVREIGKCDTCHGTGQLEPRAHCRLCGHVLTEEDFALWDADAEMTCGHIGDYVDATIWCEDCFEATGYIDRLVPLAEALERMGIVVDETLCK